MSELMIREQTQAQGQVNELMVYAQNAISSGLVPKSLKTPEMAMIVMLKGRELGLKPMQSLNHIYVVNGAAAVDTKVLAALFLARGNSFFPVKSSADECTIKFSNRAGDTFTFTMTMAECKQAKWDQTWDYDTKTYKSKPTWTAMPSIMLFYRTLSNGIRRVDPGCLLDTLTDDEVLDALQVPDEARMVDAQVRLVEAEAVEETAPAPAVAPLMCGIVAPEPNSGWETWGAVKQRGFWGAVKKVLTEEQTHQEFGVTSMKDWLYSVNQTRPVLELLAWEPEITLAEKKRGLGIEKLREIVEYGWPLADCQMAISESIGGAI
jgi:hypothetical protein